MCSIPRWWAARFCRRRFRWPSPPILLRCALHRFSEFIPTSLAIPFLKAAPLKDWIAQVQVDGFTGATPLMLQKFEHVTTDPWTLFLGDRAGSSGETSRSADSARRLLSDRAQDDGLAHSRRHAAGRAADRRRVSSLESRRRYPGPLFVLFSGGLMLGALFMATDPVASPVTPLGMWIYGLLMGLITVLIRFEGGLPEGVMYAILLGNALSPLIDNVTQPRTYGKRKRMFAKEWQHDT